MREGPPLELVDAGAALPTLRLLLEPLTRAHAPELLAALADPRIYRHLDEEPPASCAALEARYRVLESRRAPSRDELWLNWALRIVAEGSCAGYVQTTVHADRTADLAYVLAPRFWGRGYASEACRRVLELLRDDYAVTLVRAQVDPGNTPSIRLLERLGFALRPPRGHGAGPHHGCNRDGAGDLLFALPLPSGPGDDGV